jgi:hypothetical protein
MAACAIGADRDMVSLVSPEFAANWLAHAFLQISAPD